MFSQYLEYHINFPLIRENLLIRHPLVRTIITKRHPFPGTSPLPQVYQGLPIPPHDRMAACRFNNVSMRFYGTRWKCAKRTCTRSISRVFRKYAFNLQHPLNNFHPTFIHRRFLRFGYSVISSENRILRLCASIAVCNKNSYFCKNINFIRNVYCITFEHICQNTRINKTFAMSHSLTTPRMTNVKLV